MIITSKEKCTYYIPSSKRVLLSFISSSPSLNGRR